MAETPFDVDKYVDSLNRKENKDAAKAALTAMATSGTRGLEAYAQGESALGTLKAGALAEPTGGYTFDAPPGQLSAQLAATANAPVDRALGSLASSRSTFETDLERQRAASAAYFSALDASPLYPVLTGGGGGGGGGWGGGGGGGRSNFTKSEARESSMEAARAAAEGAISSLGRSSRSIASGQARTRQAASRPQRSRRVRDRLADQGETYRKLQQVLSSRVTAPRPRTRQRPTDPRLAAELADAQRQAPRGKYVSPTSRRYTTVMPRPAPRPTSRVTASTTTMPPTGRARSQRSALMNPDPAVTARIRAQADRVYGGMRDTYRTPEYQDLAARGFFDPARQALAMQEANESMRFSSIADEAQRRVREEAFKYGASPGELSDVQTIFDPYRGANGEVLPGYQPRIAGNRIGPLPEVGQLPPSVLASLRAAQAGMPEQLRIARQVMADTFGYDPGLITDADMLSYMNQVGRNQADQEGLIAERDWMARTGGAYRSADDQIAATLAPGEIMDAERAAQNYAELGFDTPQAARSYMQAQREALALQSGEFSYAGQPFKSQGDMQIAARRDIEFTEDMDRRDMVNQINQFPEYRIDEQNLQEFADITDSSPAAVSELIVGTPYRSVLNSASAYLANVGRDSKQFNDWLNQPAADMFTSPEDVAIADAAQQLDDGPYVNVWRNLVAHQVQAGS